MLFYLYEDTEITLGNWLEKIKHNVNNDLDKDLFELFKFHPKRTFTPEEASIFVIAIPFRKSMNLDSSNHFNNLELAFKTLLNKEYFKKNKGRDHLILAAHHNFGIWHPKSKKLIPQQYWKKLSNVTCTRYENFYCSPWDTEISSKRVFSQIESINNSLETKIINVPYVFPKSLFCIKSEQTKHSIIVPYKPFYELKIIEPDYNSWKNRKNLIFYHTRKKKSLHNATNLRQLPVNKKHLFEGSIGCDISKDLWLENYKNSKFALVIRGDTPGSHAFVHSISFGCIPVVISDIFSFTSLPFKDIISLEDFAVQIKEKEFLQYPEKLTSFLKNIPTKVLRSKLKNLKNIQKILLYNHKQSIMCSLILNEFIKNSIENDL